MFEDYTPDVIPICDGNPVTVKIGMALRAILDVVIMHFVAIYSWIQNAFPNRTQWKRVNIKCEGGIIDAMYKGINGFVTKQYCL